MHETRFDPWVRKIPWRRARQPTPGSLPGESHGWRSLASYSPWGREGSETTERLSTHTYFCHEVPQAGWLKTVKIHCLMFWRLEAQIFVQYFSLKETRSIGKTISVRASKSYQGHYGVSKGKRNQRYSVLAAGAVGLKAAVDTVQQTELFLRPPQCVQCPCVNR